MRYLIISDVHANLEALTAVLGDAAGRYDTALNCGDLVGYGPDPNAVVEICRETCAFVVRGNHDKACAGLADLEWFNPVAQQSVMWSASILTPENLEWLRKLPEGPLDVGSLTILHGSPADEDEYITDPSEARAAAEHVTTALSFFGHTHLQGAFQVHRMGGRLVTGREFEVDENSAWLVNPGSVGQPRDGNPDAAYALFDTATRIVEMNRVAYRIGRTHDKILNAGLPEVLALRLYHGL